MQHIQHISIPAPCHQLWQEMTPANEGRHCSHCSKIVTDFTTMNNSQIITYLATSSNVCGRLDKQQLLAINQHLGVEKVSSQRRFKGWIIAIGMLGSMSFFKAEAQIKPTVEQSADNSPIRCSVPTLGKVAINVSNKIIKGIVMDENNQPLPGVTITANKNIGTQNNIGTQSDMNGKFTLSVSSYINQFKVTFIGYTSQIINIDNNTLYQVKLTEVQQMLGELVIMKKPSFIKRTYNRYFKRSIYRIYK